jgi:signal transduction histidine kinase
MTTRLRPLVPVLAGLADLALGLTDDPKHYVAFPLVTIAVCAALYARSRHPVAVLAVHLGWSAYAAYVWDSAPVAGMLVALFTLAATRPLPLSVAGMLLTEVTLYSQLDQPDQTSTDMLLQLLAVSLVAGTAWALGRRTVAMRTAATDALRLERLRLARELHDIVSHALSGIVVQAAGAQAVLAIDPGLAARALNSIEGTGAQAMDEMHRMLGLLRSAGGEDAAPLDRSSHGLQDIGTLLDWARDNGLTPTTVVEGEPGPLDDSTSMAAYCIVQEALTNTLKHAGPGTAVDLRLSWTDADLTISVEDHPTRAAGRSPLTGGYGLSGLRERVTTVGGTFQSRALDHGYAVSARLPIAHRKRETVGGPIR